MIKKIKNEIFIGKSDMILMLSLIAVTGVVGTILMMVIRMVAYENEALPLGGLFACCMFLFYLLIMEATYVFKVFGIAVKLGRTRKEWFTSHLLAMLLFYELCAAFVYVLIKGEIWITSIWFPGSKMLFDMSGGYLQWIWFGVPVIMGLGAFLGALILHFGKIAYHICIAVWILSCLNTERIVKIVGTYFIKQFNLFAESAGMNLLIFGGGGLLAAAALLFLGTWLVIRRQQVPN